MSDFISGAGRQTAKPRVKPKAGAAAIALAKSQAYQDAAYAKGTLRATA